VRVPITAIPFALWPLTGINERLPSPVRNHNPFSGGGLHRGFVNPSPAGQVKHGQASGCHCDLVYTFTTCLQEIYWLSG